MSKVERVTFKIGDSDTQALAGANVALSPAVSNGKRRLVASGDCWLRIGSAAAVNAGMFLPANQIEYIQLDTNEVLNVFGASGFLNITKAE